MTLTQSSTPSWFAHAARSFGKGASAVALLFAAGALTAGCLDRPVTPATPQTTNVYINQIRQTGVDKIDLLFMIDNSISMSDKQAILAQAVPVLVERLITPTCVDMDGNPVGGGAVADANGRCATGVAEFKPIKDIHIGVITSSLGDHGSNDVCSDAQNAANMASSGVTSNYNDAAQLLPSVRANLYSWNNQGFLVWDPRDQTMVTDKHTPITANETMKDTFIMNFSAQVQAAGEHGCGYEASLEAWYRFLVNPEPVKSMTNDMAVAHRPLGADGKSTALNDALLQQRANFMRPDSLLAVVMLSDENDCSIVDEEGAQGWLVGYKGGVNNLSWHMPRAKAACATNPNSSACGPCVKDDPDPGCAMGANLGLDEDSMNERCFNQRQRFGIDLLYPTGRYVEGLSRKFITPRFGGGQVPNPIFQASAAGVPAREAELVFLAGIVGVPWQDVAPPEDWPAGTRTLKYLTAQEIADQGRWDVMLGAPFGDPVVLPTDPLMIESIDPRPAGAVHPLINTVSVQAPTGGMNAINGHEQAVLPERDDLQFACIFPLMPEKSAADCTANPDGCDCNADEFAKSSPLCAGTTDAADGRQVAAKAYPGVRELQVLKDLQNQSIVASICPKNITAQGAASSDPDFGYNPAVAAIVDRLKEALTVKCLPRPLSPDTLGSSDPAAADYNPDVGKVPCAVVEVRPQQPDGTCPICSPETGRSDLVGERVKVKSAALEFLRNEGECDRAAIPCSQECFCELTQFTGDALTACQTGTDSGAAYGYCYVDPEAAQSQAEDPASDGGAMITGGEQALIDGETTLVKDCTSTQKRILRFIGENVPAKDGIAFIACIGANPNN